MAVGMLRVEESARVQAEGRSRKSVYLSAHFLL